MGKKEQINISEISETSCQRSDISLLLLTNLY